MCLQGIGFNHARSSILLKTSGLLNAFVAGLAYYLSAKLPEVDPNRVLLLKADYNEQWDLASSEDREKAPIRFVPRQLFY